MFSRARIVRIRTEAVIRFRDMGTAAVHIEMNILPFKIRRNSFPHRHLRMQLFNSAPGGITDTSAVNAGRNKEDLQIPRNLHPQRKGIFPLIFVF